MISLRYSDVEDELRASVRRVLADRAPWQAVLARVESSDPYDTGLWQTLAADVGCAGLAVPQDRGGAGGSYREAAVVAEELGRAVAPVPHLGAAMATAALLSGQDCGLLAKAAAGEVLAVLALPLSTRPGAGLPGTVTADGERLTGAVGGVADALPADLLLVPANGGLWAVSREAADVSEVISLDMTRPLADVTLAGARATRVADAAPAVAAALLAGTVLLASEQLGIAEWCLDATLAYVKRRQQFGRPVGSFQAVKHRLAQLWVAVTQARATARYAAGCLAEGDPDTAVAAALAQAHCGPVAVQAAEQCVQLHGAIGFTWEHPAHLYLKRAKADAIALGTAAHHRDVLGDLLTIDR
ncbi:acyl-CoA dehydrogenase family protein [Phytohabitans flavus]|uniref:Acyl-CoA dehydrogenase n=1 Tax=Phytohabitans flavus TaxID=1076124 RepID=A0A6F8XM89_9ACTN|nr:acyl-CoA dehydrogenase family protein [Phytohabitans flavus]BCB74908.1 acyl-CoA dehydrogenase [Phytohabitans flavus]